MLGVRSHAAVDRRGLAGGGAGRRRRGKRPCAAATETAARTACFRHIDGYERYRDTKRGDCEQTFEAPKGSKHHYLLLATLP
ncbi:hypothetical protein X971_3644 [Agrobacterium tumefaciens LBA4213 (Ach5)]|nr:hypothetical protein X971_3644 [Agrobacterium tumefaciens LBA4213 (Ach5)]